MPEALEPEVGQELRMRDKSGNAFPVRVTSIDEKRVTVDANHPLAGRELTFDIALLEIL
jgi:peptidylprolyl isomerase